MTRIERIKRINDVLENVGSNFRTKDGLTVSAYIGHLTFLKKSYSSIEELEHTVDRLERRADA